ncbi:MAG: MFS transporter [Candidatus Bipolaricaulota bacterium]|nr:MAG: MFS transporter [Candidatus Bipolaricaulota bacterium]
MARSLRSWWTDAEPWFAAVGLANTAMGTSSVLIPLMLARVLDRSVGDLGWLAALVSLMGVAGSLVWGRLSDAAHRRKPFILASYAAVCIAHAALAFVGSFAEMLVLNMALNLLWVANASVTVLVVIENRAEPLWEAKIGKLNQIGALGWVAGLGLGSALLAGFTALFGEVTAIRSLFLMVSSIALAAVITAALTVPRTEARFTARRFRGMILAVGNFLVERGRFSPFHLYHRLRPVQAARRLFGFPGFRPGTRRLLASTFLSYLAFGLFGIPLPLALADRFGVAPAIVFVYFLIQHAAIVIAYPIASRRIRRLGNRRIQIFSLVGRTVIFSVVALLAASGVAVPTVVLVIAFLSYGVTWSYFQLSGVALVSRLARRENRGLALGLYNATAGVGWIVAGVGSGLIAGSLGFAASFAAGAGVLLVGLAVLSTVPDPTAAAPDHVRVRWWRRRGDALAIRSRPSLPEGPSRS